MLRALNYADGLVAREDARATNHTSQLCTGESQVTIWSRKMLKAAQHALAPSGSECLVRKYVDRQGNAQLDTGV